MKLTAEGIKAHVEKLEKDGDAAVIVAMATVNAMIGGGLLGNFAVNQPGAFYIDSRVGKLRYPKQAIKQAVNILAAYQKRNAGVYERQVRLYHKSSLNTGVY